MKQHIPFVDLQTEHKKQIQSLKKAFATVCDRGVFVLGDSVRTFEAEFARYLGAKYAVGVASGTDALLLALKAIGITPQDEVLVPANAYPTAFAVSLSGAKIRLVDIDPQTYTIDPRKIESAITKKTKAIIVVHLYGQAAKMDTIMRITRKTNIAVIEDVAQAHGSTYKNKKLGTIGDIGCFSFYPTKNLGALGDGGMIVTNTKRIAEQIQRLRNYGEKKRYVSTHLGYNSRLDELQAALLSVKLSMLDKNNKKRQRLAKAYLYNLRETSVQLPTTHIDESHVYHLFVIRTKKRNSLQAYLQGKGITTLIHYPTPIHSVKAFLHLGYKTRDFPQAEKSAKEILSLPLYPTLSLDAVSYICNHIKNHLQ